MEMKPPDQCQRCKNYILIEIPGLEEWKWRCKMELFVEDFKCELFKRKTKDDAPLEIEMVRKLFVKTGKITNLEI